MASWQENIPGLKVEKYNGFDVLHCGTALRTVFMFGKTKAKLVLENIDKVRNQAGYMGNTMIEKDNIKINLKSEACCCILKYKSDIENFVNGKAVN